MKKYIGTILTSVIVITLIVLGFVFGLPSFNDVQKETFIILLIICGSSALYCFVVGEISRNNSQMDKLWSILPIVYTWVIAIKGNMDPRLVIYAILVSIWGIRLTINFARKGAYTVKFWAGEEDYRWKILRSKKPFSNKFLWAMFDLFFISIYQNVLVLAICLPSLVCMSSTQALGTMDFIAIFLVSGFILMETIADEEQMFFYTTRNNFLKQGKKLEELPEPFNKGFNTFGLWKRCRHPNYFAEQMIWICLYLFVIGANQATYYVFNWSMVGPLVLVLLFLGSSTLGENISSSKYPEYQYYQKSVTRYFPLWDYDKEKAIKKYGTK